MLGMFQGVFIKILGLATLMVQKSACWESFYNEHADSTAGADGEYEGRWSGDSVIVHRGVTPLHVSESWAAVHGYTAAEILKMTSIESLRHPDDRARMAAYADERAAGRYAPDRYAYRGIRKDGSVVWLDVAVRVDEWQGEPAINCTIVGVREAVDEVIRLTDRRQRASPVELHLLNVIDQLPDGYALFDADERLVIWNQRYAQYAPSFVAPLRTGDLFEPLLRAQVWWGVIDDAIGQEEAWIDMRLAAFRAADNRSIDVSYDDRKMCVRHLKTHDGGTLLVITDVTEVIKAENDIRIYASALEQVSDRVSIVDKDYRFLFANAAVLRSYRMNKEDILGRHIADLIGQEQFYRVSKADLDRCFTGGTVRTERAQRNAAGKLCHLDVRVEPFRMSDGTIIGAIAVMRDVTEATTRGEELQLARSVIDQISERVVVVDRDQRIRLVNQRNLDFFGCTAEESIGRPLGALIGWERYRRNPERMIREAIETGKSSRHEYWRPDANGDVRYWETSVVPYRESDSTLSGAIATTHEVTELRRAVQLRQRFQDAIEQLRDCYALFDSNERLQACNHAYEQMHAPVTPDFGLGVPFETIIRGRTASGKILDAIGREEEWIAERLAGFRAESYIADYQVAGGNWVHVRNRRTEDGGTLLLVADVTESKRVEQALAESKVRFKDFTELATDWFWEQDAQGCFTYVSESFESLTGWSISDVIGKSAPEVYADCVLADDKWQGLIQEKRVKGIDRTIEFDHDLPTAEGRLLRIRTTFRPIKNVAGVIVGYRGAAKDITENHQLAKQLEYQANHDELTGLPNRRAFERHLERAIEESAEGRRSAVFCFIDLDQFKIVNDTAGHLAGDRLLQHVAGLLKAKLRKCDVLARLGGDEFGLLLFDCSLRRARTMARNLVAFLNEDRFVYDESIFEISASIGLTQVGFSSGNVGQLMAEADLACYAAKDAGRNRVQVYQPNNRELAQRRDEMSKASLIRRALDEDRFVLFAQPIQALAHPDKDPASYEVLLRIVCDDGTLATAGEFVSAAERYGLMAEIDRWVIEQSFAKLREFLAERRDISININLSGLSLNEGGLVRFVTERLAFYRIPPRNVCFEVTETAAIRSLSRTKTLIAKLKAIGCSFALDDFGSGLSSFGYLQQLPFDYVKIDGTFVHKIPIDTCSRAMVEAIHKVARSLNLKSVAEGVETDETVQVLRTMGLDYVQGFALGKPAPLANLSTPVAARGYR